ncbi:FAD-dependent oxidoreductase [Burkholderia sp. WAC0059]|uniref:NAD(P)/FAD-dependent oxidoreductase n=1 Tax=Burkholderia sp. WAC0059 TaxID=2066022 RepID=UPI000C7F5CB5|nr:FAD-dependent oxidoreductase [Burkholderia sp. WAC0059]PLZ00470.1 FAD-dependent oxidoreductase [Burkholderia sp. WAC0059]
MTTNSQSDSNAPIAVLGAGIIGVCAAAYLQRAGHQVLLIDRQPPGEATSYGNAGCLNGSSIVPSAMPGVLAKVPQWLLDPDGPLVLRLGYVPRMLPWLMRFVASSRPDKVDAQARALRALFGRCLDDYAPLVRDAGLERMLHRHGHLVAYTTEEGYAGDAGATALRARNGVVVEDVALDELRAIEPDLSPKFIRARRIAETGHVTDPGAFVKGLAQHVIDAGGRFQTADVRGLETAGDRVTGVVTAAGVLPVRGAVVALGAWSAPLARQLGDRVLLDTERGYHVEVPDAAHGPRVPTLWSEAKIFATPMDGRLRCAGTVELAGLDAPPNWARATLLERQLARMYPALTPDIERVQGQHRWLGFRPSTPDSLPVLGRASRFGNAVYAFGHAHVGLTAAASTGRIVAELLSGAQPSIDLTPFAASRFR